MKERELIRLGCIGTATAAAYEGEGFEKMRKEQELLPCSSV